MLGRRALVGGAVATAVTAVASRRGAADQRVVSDSAGRTVTLPPRIDRVFAAGPPASILVYALAPLAVLEGR